MELAQWTISVPGIAVNDVVQLLLDFLLFLWSAGLDYTILKNRQDRQYWETATATEDDMSGFNDADAVIFVAKNHSFRRSDNEYFAFYVVFYVALTVGIPSNILSAIVWVRHGIASKSSSAVYLTAVSLNDLVYLLTTFLYIDVISKKQLRWLHGCASYLAMCAATLEPLLVLGFSVERLIAIRYPLRVRCSCVLLIMPWCM